MIDVPDELHSSGPCIEGEGGDNSAGESRQDCAPILEALLFARGEPVSDTKLAAALVTTVMSHWDGFGLPSSTAC